MGKGHIAVNKYISDKARFADLINGAYFGGKQIVLPEQLEQVTGEYEILLEDKNGKSIGKTRYRDVIMRWNNEIDFCFIAYENQGRVHYAMPVRDMLYDGVSYTMQIAELWKSHNKGKNQELEPAEYLSRFRKEDKIYPVLTIVFYYGSEPWDGNRDLYSMFRLSEPAKELLKKYVPNYWINVFEADNVEDITCFKTDLQKIIGMLKCKKDKGKLIQYIQENEEFFGNVDYNTQQAIGEFLQSEQLAKKMVKRSDREESYNMCKALDDWYQEGVEKGREEMRSVMDEVGIQNLIEASQEYGQSQEATISKLIEKYQLAQDVAVEKVTKYWK